MEINKFDINIDLKLDINKDDLLKCFDNIKSHKYKDILYWIIKDQKKEYIIYEKNKVLYIQKKYGSKKYNDTEIKKSKNESKNESEMESKYGGSDSEYIASESEYIASESEYSEDEYSEDDTKCNFLSKKSNEILCLEKLLRYIKYTQRSSNKKTDVKISTFTELETFLRKSNYDKIHDFMKEYSLEFQQKFEPLESVFRLFCSKKLIKIYDEPGNDILENSYISTNNFGAGEVNITDDQSVSGNLKDSGDISDLTFVNKDTSTIYICSSKNYKDYSGKGKKFDLEKIHSVYNEKYKNVFENIITIVVVRDKNEVLNAMKNMTFSSKDSKKLLKNSHLLDFDDINQAYRKFKYETDDPIHLRYFKELELKKKDIVLMDKNDNPRIFKGWNLEDEKKCKLGKIDKLDDIPGSRPLHVIIKTFSTTEIINYYKNLSYIFSILLEETDDYIKLIFGETVIVNEEQNIRNQEYKDNLYNILQNYCVLNNSKEEVSILVIVENLDNLKYNIENDKKYGIVMEKDIAKIELEELKKYNTLVNLSDNSIDDIVQNFLKVNSDKSYNFIVDKDNNRLNKINDKFGIKDFFVFKSNLLPIPLESL